MLFVQLKSLAYFIFATIVVCQIPPGNYIIRNRQVNSEALALFPPNPNDPRVIARPLQQGPVQFATWNISPAPSAHNFIKDVQTGRFLSAQGNQVILIGQPFPWIIRSQNDAFLITPINNPQALLTINPNTNPHSINVAETRGPITEWIFARTN